MSAQDLRDWERQNLPAHERSLALRAANGDHRGYAQALRKVAQLRQEKLVSRARQILSFYRSALDDWEEYGKRGSKAKIAEHADFIERAETWIDALDTPLPEPREDKPW